MTDNLCNSCEIGPKQSSVARYGLMYGAHPLLELECRGGETNIPGVRNSVAVILPDIPKHYRTHCLHVEIMRHTSCNTFHLHKEQN